MANRAPLKTSFTERILSLFSVVALVVAANTHESSMTLCFAASAAFFSVTIMQSIRANGFPKRRHRFKRAPVR